MPCSGNKLPNNLPLFMSSVFRLREVVEVEAGAGCRSSRAVVRAAPASAPPSWGHPRNSRVSVLPRHGQPRWNRLSSSAAVARRGSANWANFSLLPTTQCGPHQGRTSRSAPWCAMANSWRVNARKVLGRPACPASLILGRQTAQPAGVAAPQPTEHRPGCRQAVDSGSRRQISLAVAPLRGRSAAARGRLTGCAAQGDAG